MHRYFAFDGLEDKGVHHQRLRLKLRGRYDRQDTVARQFPDRADVIRQRGNRLGIAMLVAAYLADLAWVRRGFFLQPHPGDPGTTR